MSDRLAVIQSEVSVEEIRKIIAEVKPLITLFKELKNETNKVNQSFRSGKVKEYADALKNLTEVSRQFQQINAQISAQAERLSRIERNNAQATAENARARKENALAANQEAAARDRASKQAARESKANSDSANAYKRLSQEANRVKLAAKTLEAEILILNRDFRSGVISQERYNQELAKLQGQFSATSTRAKQLDTELKRIDANVGDKQRNVGNYRDAAKGSIMALDKQIKTMIASYAGFYAIINGTSSLIHNNYELSDSLADLQIRLHGNKEATDKLFDSLRKIDTRTSLGELVNTAAIVAKKGVAADEIEGITKALDNYFIVAGKEAGNREEGTASIIKLISIFNEDKHITAERVTEISTALVKLQNSGVATGSKMIDIAERIGAVRGITGVTLPQVLGFAAAIEQLGQKSEVAGTAGMQILTKVLSDMPKYAKLANVSVEELRKAYSDNPFEAVVMVAQGVLKTGDFERISQDLEEVGVRGARVKGVLGDIASNADFVRKRIKDAGLAINEEGYLAETAAKKQETFAATIDKVKKEFELIGASDGFRNFIKGVSDVLLGFIKILTAIPFGVVITGLTLLTAAWAYYKGALVQATIAKQWNNNESLLGTLRNKAARLGLLGEAESIRANTILQNANTTARSLNVASLESQIAAERAAIVSLQAKTAANEAEAIAIRAQIASKEALIVALEAEVVATNEATAATTGLNTATKASPLGIIFGILAVLVPLMLMYADNTEEAAKKTRTLAENQEDLNQALDKGVKNAAEEVSHLDQLYQKYTDGNTKVKEKKEILKELQDFYPSFFGNLKTEKDLNDKLTQSYVELRAAIVSAARADAIKDKLKGRASERLTRDEQLNREMEKELELNKKLRADAKLNKVVTRRYDGGDGKSFTVTLESNDLLEASNQRIKNQNFIKANNAKADYLEDKNLLDMYEREEKFAKKVREDRANRLGKFAKGEDEDKKKDKASALTGAQKDAIMIMEAARDTELAINEKKFIEGNITEIEYLNKSLKINIEFYDKKIAYLKGKNAKEKSLEAKAELDKATTVKEIRDKIYGIESKQIEENNKKKINLLERASKQIEDNEYLTDYDRLNQQIEVDNKMIDQMSKYYFAQIELAKDANQDVVEWERKRDEEIGKIQDARMKRMSSLPDAAVNEIERQAEILNYQKDISYEEQRRLILQNKKLTSEERSFQLDILEKQNQVAINDREIERLQTLRAQLIVKQAINQVNGFPPLLSPEDEKQLNEIDATIAKLTSENQVINIELKESVDGKTQKFREIVEKGFSDLGFSGLADAYAATMERLKNETASWRDYAVLAASAVLDAMSQLSQRQKERTIANLDEQLKVSQENTDLEIGFINNRLEAYSNMDDLTKEQIEERNRLEDQARTFREQQQQREKLIATQKAKAEQKAAAQQALINGALAATQTLAQLGFAAGAIPAALALAFGIAQSIAISSKNPIPQYWKGRERGPAEMALTQERGREIITDKHGNIKDLGSDGGAKMTWLEKDDKVITADKTRSYISRLKELREVPKIGSNMFRKIAMNSLRAPVVQITMPKTEDHSSKIIAGLNKIDSSIKRTSNPYYERAYGKIFKYHGDKNPEIVGEYDLTTLAETWYQ